MDIRGPITLDSGTTDTKERWHGNTKSDINQNGNRKSDDYRTTSLHMDDDRIGNRRMEDFFKIDVDSSILEYVIGTAVRPMLSKTEHIPGRKMSFPEYTLAEVREHSDSSSCWVVLSDKVYDVTEFLNKHPGGLEIMLENAGTDATVPFDSKGHSVHAYSLLEHYYIGELAQNDRRDKK